VELSGNGIRLSLGKVCTKFVERNDLFPIPHVIFYQAVKVAVDLMCVYNVGMFEFKEGSGYLERITVCQFLGSLFGELFSLELGFVSEEELEKDEEVTTECYLTYVR
jgi:hypothetical protein